MTAEVQPRWKGKTFKLSAKARATAREKAAYSVWRREQLESRNRCEACPRVHHSGFVRRSVVLHHRRLVKQLGALISTMNTLAVCAECHDWIHAHPEVSKALALLVTEGHPEWDACGVPEVAP